MEDARLGPSHFEADAVGANAAGGEEGIPSAEPAPRGCGRHGDVVPHGDHVEGEPAAFPGGDKSDEPLTRPATPGAFKVIVKGECSLQESGGTFVPEQLELALVLEDRVGRIPSMSERQVEVIDHPEGLPAKAAGDEIVVERA
jgi:hypothetical protein